MSEYSAEELLRLSKFIKDMQSVLGGSRDDNDDDEARAWDDYEKASSALAAYAERIKADEGANDRIDFKGMWNAMSDRAYAHQPAQAAQGELVDCPECGSRCTYRSISMSDDVIYEYTPAQTTQVDPAAKLRTLADFVNAPDAERVQIGQQVAARVDEMMAEPVAQPADSGRVPDGWVLVPREPTAAMLDAAMTREDDEPLTDWGKIIPAPHAEIYKAMLAAAPQPGESA